MLSLIRSNKSSYRAFGRLCAATTRQNSYRLRAGPSFTIRGFAARPVVDESVEADETGYAQSNGNSVGKGPQEQNDNKVDWSKSFHGLSQEPFPKEIADVLLAETSPDDIEIKPDGILFLPEIKYRRILNRAFGPGGWGMAPRGEVAVTDRSVSREYALVCHGRLVSVARGEQEYFDPNGVSTATEGWIASELWDPRFIRRFKKEKCIEVWGEHATTKKKRKVWRRKDDPPLSYPFKETTS